MREKTEELKQKIFKMFDYLDFQKVMFVKVLPDEIEQLDFNGEQELKEFYLRRDGTTFFAACNVSIEARKKDDSHVHFNCEIPETALLRMAQSLYGTCKLKERRIIEKTWLWEATEKQLAEQHGIEKL